MRVASRRMANPLFGENGSEPTPLSPPQRVDDSLYGEESFYAPGAFEIDYSIDSPESVPAPNAAGVKGSTGTRGAQNQPPATSLGDISCADGKRGAGSNGTVEPAYVSAPVVFDGISGNDGGYALFCLCAVGMLSTGALMFVHFVTFAEQVLWVDSRQYCEINK